MSEVDATILCVTDDMQPNQPDESDLDPWLSADDPDPMLDVLAGLLEANQLTSLGLTVNVSGQVITGTMVSRSSWFDAVLDGIPDRGAASVVEQVRSHFDAQFPEGNCLHLVNANLVAGQVVSDTKGGHWRCKISAVNSWCLGEMSSD